MISSKNGQIVSLIKTSSNGQKIEIVPEHMQYVNNYVACLGPPRSGKSAFCCAFYFLILH